MRLFTSNFASVKALRAARIVPVGIAIGPPRWYKGDNYKALAPTRAMLKLPPNEYDRLYEEILSKLDPQQVWDDLAKFGPEVAILCWEAKNVRCHRRRAAEWLEETLVPSVVVPEFGLARELSLPYCSLPSKKAGLKHLGKTATRQRGQR